MEKGDERADLERIFMSAVDRADPYKMLIRHMRIDNEILKIGFEEAPQEFRLTDFDRIRVFGVGKAASRMAKAVEEIFKDRLSGGLLSVKYGYTEKLDRIETIEAGHPVPDENSVRAARKMMETAGVFTDKTLAIVLISGGGSALLECPARYEGAREVTLEDMQKTTQALLDCGAGIEEINCIRKHVSMLKGGRFAGILYPATAVCLILSDVVGDRLDAIASGLTAGDPTTFQDALDIIGKYGLEEKLPASIIGIIRLGAEKKLPDTPKPGDKIFNRVHNILIGANYDSLVAASTTAAALGYHPLVLTSQLTGEARELAKFLIGIARDVIRRGALTTLPACLIAGGETTVTICGAGKGGRNQEMALSFLSELQKNGQDGERLHFLAASTDGNDGPTDAAGAFASLEILQRAADERISIDPYLQNNDSYHFFERLNALLKTGPTNTNVCDVQILLIK